MSNSERQHICRTMIDHIFQVKSQGSLDCCVFLASSSFRKWITHWCAHVPGPMDRIRSASSSSVSCCCVTVFILFKRWSDIAVTLGIRDQWPKSSLDCQTFQQQTFVMFYNHILYFVCRFLPFPPVPLVSMLYTAIFSRLAIPRHFQTRLTYFCTSD